MKNLLCLRAAFLATALMVMSTGLGSVHAAMRPLADVELDAVTVGFDYCALFGVQSPCVASALQLFNPQSAPQSHIIALPLPSNGTVTLSQQASSFSPDGTRFQIATQVNSASNKALAQSFAGKVDLSPETLLLRTAPIIHP